MVSLKRVKINFIVACKYSHRSYPLRLGMFLGNLPHSSEGKERLQLYSQQSYPDWCLVTAVTV